MIDSVRYISYYYMNAIINEINCDIIMATCFSFNSINNFKGFARIDKHKFHARVGLGAAFIIVY